MARQQELIERHTTAFNEMRDAMLSLEERLSKRFESILDLQKELRGMNADDLKKVFEMIQFMRERFGK